jgi:hypothetical protein
VRVEFTKKSGDAIFDIAANLVRPIFVARIEVAAPMQGLGDLFHFARAASASVTLARAALLTVIFASFRIQH